MGGQLKPSVFWVALSAVLMGSAGSSAWGALEAGETVRMWVAVGLFVFGVVCYVTSLSAYEKAFETWVKRGKP